MDLSGINPDDIPEESLDKLIEDLSQLAKKTFLEYVPHEKQNQFHQSLKKTRAIFGGNRSGKTEAGCVEGLFHSLGDYPSWYPADGRFRTPTRGRIIVTDFKKGGTGVVEPKLLKWCPKDRIKKAKYYQGHLESLEVYHALGGVSNIEILTHEQDDNVFAGWSGHWAWFDEPPPRSKYVETIRGLIDYGGRSWLTLTPISEPWLYDEIVRKVGDRVFYVVVDIRDNPYMNEKDIADFEASLMEEEKESRLHGKFLHLTGLVYKSFDPNIHIVNDPGLKRDWPVYFVCDPHDRKPHFGLWAKIDPFGTIYIIDEIKFKGTIKDFSKEVLKRELLSGIVPLDVIRIGDPNKMETPTAVTGLKLKEEFASHALYFITNVNDNIPVGHLAVSERLSYDKTKPLSSTNKPKLFFFKDRTTQIINQIQSYVYDDWRDSGRSQKEKPKDVNKDFPDCLRYLVMFKPVFHLKDDSDPSPFDSDERAMPGFISRG